MLVAISILADPKYCVAIQNNKKETLGHQKQTSEIAESLSMMISKPPWSS